MKLLPECRHSFMEAVGRLGCEFGIGPAPSPVPAPAPSPATRGPVPVRRGRAVAANLDLSAMPSLTTGNGIAAATPPRAWSYHDLLRAELARPAQLVDPFIAAGTAGFLAGPPNVGKSWLLYAIALAVATGTPWLGRFPARPGRVLVVDEESTDYYIRERLLMLAAGLGLADDDLPIRFLVNHGLRVDDARGFAALDAEMSAHRPDLVLADSLIRLHGAEETLRGRWPMFSRPSSA